MSRDDAVRVQHMIDAIEAAVRFAEGRSRSDLDRDEMLLFALVRAVEIVGEAAGKLSGEGRAQTSSGGSGSMAISNHERVGKALELLKAGLGPFVDRELKNAFKDRAQEQAAATATTTCCT